MKKVRIKRGANSGERRPTQAAVGKIIRHLAQHICMRVVEMGHKSKVIATLMDDPDPASAFMLLAILVADDQETAYYWGLLQSQASLAYLLTAEVGKNLKKRKQAAPHLEPGAQPKLSLLKGGKKGP